MYDGNVDYWCHCAPLVSNSWICSESFYLQASKLLPMFCSHRGVLADEAENIAAAHDDVLLAKILDKEECEALKMGEYLGVAAASSNPPKFIHLRYTPPSGNVKTKLAIVGKGLSFDR